MTGGPVSRFWTSADGLRLHAYDYPAAAGDARLPVVCLHGLTRNGRDFDTLAPWIAARSRRALALDIRGRGRSARDPRADYRLPTYAGDVAALLDALGIVRALFVGTSMGGLITMEVAAVRPALVAGAIVNDVGPEISPVGLARIAGYAGKAPAIGDWEEAAAYVRMLNAPALPHYGAAEWAAMARRLFAEAPDGAIVPDYDPAIAGAFANAPLMADPWDRWNMLVRDRPVLLLRGARSDLLDPDIVERMTAGQDHVTSSEYRASAMRRCSTNPSRWRRSRRFWTGSPDLSPGSCTPPAGAIARRELARPLFAEDQGSLMMVHRGCQGLSIIP